MIDTNPDARFEADWLALREAADHQARASRLSACVADWLGVHARQPWPIVDLGAGSGSNLRYLAPRLPGAQHWRLVDHDPVLLDRALANLPAADASSALAVDTRNADLTRTDPQSLIGDARLVTAAALFDLVDSAWTEALANACRQTGAAALFALTVDGRIVFDRPDVDDDHVLALLDAHQRRDKGFGAALGTRAPAALATAFRAAGFEVFESDSAWRLHGATHAPLAAALIRGWQDAATEQAPGEADDLAAWAARRIDALNHGATGLTVGHRDLFARPARP